MLKLNTILLNNNTIYFNYSNYFNDASNSLLVNIFNTSEKNLVISNELIEEIIKFTLSATECLSPIEITLALNNLENTDNIDIYYTLKHPLSVMFNKCKLSRVTLIALHKSSSVQIYESVINEFTSSEQDFRNLSISLSEFTNKFVIEISNIEGIRISTTIFNCRAFISFVTSESTRIINSSFNKQVLLGHISAKYNFDMQDCFFDTPPCLISTPSDIKSFSRDTLRLYKATYERQLNKIEANKFHALELSKKREELNDEVKSNFKQFNFSKLTQLLPDWLIFSLHGITSNHSQSWILPIYWIIILSLFGATFEYGNIVLSGISYSLLMIPFFAMHFIGVFNQKIFKPLVFILGFSTAFYFYYVFNNFSMANVFKYLENSFQFSGSDIHGFHYVFNKAIIAYLTYQFILGVRKDTRR
ncbi:MAG: hypothetical protein AB7E76_13800 [Deferribacterales bacterium]